MIKAVIFDLDDTLCNTSNVLEPALRTTFARNLSHFPGKTVDEMIQINKQAFSETFLNPDIPISSATMLIWMRSFELLGITPPIKATANIIEHIREDVRKKIQLIDGAKDILIYLKSQGIKIGVLSNGAFMEQAQKVIILGIDTYIDYLVTPDICIADKPNKKAFDYILSKLEVKAENAIMVGDNYNMDIKGAENAGIRGIYFSHKPKREVRPVDGVKETIHTLSEIKNLLETY